MDKFYLLKDIIRKRRSIFPVSYNSKEIEDTLISEILETGNWAPTHKKTEPWRYIVIKGQKLIELGSFMYDDYTANTPEASFSQRKAHKRRKNAINSAAVIAICMKRHENIPEWEEIAAVSMSVQNIWLACSAQNIGSYWSTPNTINRLADFLQLEKDERCLGLFYMGYYDTELPDGERNPMEDKVKWL